MSEEDSARQRLWNNAITVCGVFLAASAVVLLFMFGLFSLVTPTTNPYVDIVGYLVVPCILVIGLVMMPSGIFFASWLRRRRDPQARLVFWFPRMNLNDPVQWRLAKLVGLGSLILLPVVAVTSYQGYHYTESADFCAKACHQVMKPQATTYANSAHARVACAECHIGSGASWFVKAKLSGTRQVFATLQKSYPRPIPPAITELRPARETCERCHWPKKFFGAQLRENTHYSSDEGNTPYRIEMLLKTGGGDETTGRAEGIHMHMAIANRIEYIAADAKLQDIPWVRMIDPAGNEVIYRSDGRPSSDPRPEGLLRGFDCMDCHNRPAHKFRSPQESVDTYLRIGRIDSRLPFIKRQAVEVLSRAYPSIEVGETKIGMSISEFYHKQYSAQWESIKAAVYQAIDSVREIYRRNTFPDMNVDWLAYPDNIGHFNSPGCFRCHEGKHVNQRGEVLSSKCQTCHTFLNPVKESAATALIQKGEFVHPVKLPAQHEKLRCYQCHTGGKGPAMTCQGCHEQQQSFIDGSSKEFKLPIEPSSMSDSTNCQDCHHLAEGTGWTVVKKTCTDCHEDKELEGWHGAAEEMLQTAERQTDPQTRAIIKMLRAAGPLHNLAATRAIIKSLSGVPAAPQGKS